MARYDWTPFFSAINGAIDDYSERQQYAGLLGGGTNGPAPSSGLLSGVPPEQLAMLRKLPPKVGMKMLGDLIKPAEYDPTPRFTADGRPYLTGKNGTVKYLDASITPREKVEIAGNGQAYNPYQTKPGAVFNDPNKPFNLGTDGRPVANTQVQQYETGLAQARRPITSVNVNTQRNYAGAMADQLAKQDAALLDAGRSAPKRIQTAQTVLQILDTETPITGFGADFRLGLNRAFATAGLTDGKSVASTETLMAMLNQQTLDAIKSSGLGSGQGFTDKDRQFLQESQSGRFVWTKEALRRAAHLAEKAGFATIAQSNKVAGRLKGNPDFGSVGQDLEIQAPKPYGAQRTPPGAQAPVRIMNDADFDRLPSGAVFIDPEGNQRRKP